MQTKYKNLQKLIIAQSKVESANYTSDLYKRSNNAFGMKNAYLRPQIGFKVFNDPYRHYDSLDESIKDFLLYLNYFNFPTSLTASEYVSTLKDFGYFESSESDYLKALKSWL